MTEEEFSVLDELYFIQDFNQLLESTGMSEEELKSTLFAILQKGWAKPYHPADQEIVFDADRFEKNYMFYHYIATKAGLLAHNGR